MPKHYTPNFGIINYPFGNRGHLAGYIQFVYFGSARPLLEKRYEIFHFGKNIFQNAMVLFLLSW